MRNCATPLLLAALAGALAAALAATAAPAAPTAPRAPLGILPVTKEFMVPMRDGVLLHTLVDFPPFYDGKPKTVVVDASPYGQNELEELADIWLLFDMIGVRQDVRGTKKSGGTFSLWHQTANDSFDTYSWILAQNFSNGDIYTIGASADGLTEIAGTMSNPPGLKKQYVIFASSLGHEVIFPNGGYHKALVEMWLDGTVPSEGPELIQQVMQNEAPGTWWTMLNMSNRYDEFIRFPSSFWAGWYDIFLEGNLAAFNGYQYESALPGQSSIVIDPLGHCQEASIYFPKHLIEGRVLLPLLLAIDLFTGHSFAEGVSPVTFYVMSSTDSKYGNYWTSLDAFPAFNATSFYLRADGSLADAPDAENDVVSFVFDPSNPVPTLGGSNLAIKCGPLDQRPNLNRSDVIYFRTPALTAPLPLTGPLQAVLYVSSNCTDTDFSVMIADVYPSGATRLLQDAVLRMRWRDLANTALPQPMQPGEVYEVLVDLWNTSYVLAPGHRLHVSISSSNYPRFSVNPNNGLPLSQNGTALIAENAVLMGPDYPSRLVLPVVTLDQMPAHKVLNDIASAQPADPRVAAAVAAAQGIIERHQQRWVHEHAKLGDSELP